MGVRIANTVCGAPFLGSDRLNEGSIPSTRDDPHTPNRILGPRLVQFHSHQHRPAPAHGSTVPGQHRLAWCQTGSPSSPGPYLLDSPRRIPVSLGGLLFHQFPHSFFFFIIHSIIFTSLVSRGKILVRSFTLFLLLNLVHHNRSAPSRFHTTILNPGEKITSQHCRLASIYQQKQSPSSSNIRISINRSTRHCDIHIRPT